MPQRPISLRCIPLVREIGNDGESTNVRPRPRHAPLLVLSPTRVQMLKGRAHGLAAQPRRSQTFLRTGHKEVCFVVVRAHTGNAQLLTYEWLWPPSRGMGCQGLA